MIDTALKESEQAFFTVEQQKIPVDFNPATLQLTVQSQKQGESGGTVQHVASSSAKLDLELVFDSTGTGEDVRKRTQPIERLMVPAEKKAPPKVTFEWGAFSFEGVVDSFKQTLDFFSRNGVPLRAIVGLSIAQLEYKFDPLASTEKADVDDTLDLPGGDPSSLAAAGGDPSAARLIASANGLESLRASASASVSVGGGVSIGAAAGFSAGAGASFGLSAGAGVGGGVSFGGGAGVGAAFAGLQTGGTLSPGMGKNFAVARLMAATSAPAVSAGAKFDVSGKASLAGGSSFKADVSGGVQFDEV